MLPFPHPTVSPFPLAILRTDAADILHRASALLDREEEEFICCAINGVNGWTEASFRLKDWIRSQLANQCTLEGWLKYTHRIDIEETPEYREATKEARLRWIEAMIRELEG